MDKETQAMLTDADEVRATLSGTGWRIIEDKLKARILDLQNINNLPDGDPSAMMQELKARVLASKLLFDWLKLDVHGFVEQQDANRATVEQRDEAYIHRNT